MPKLPTKARDLFCFAVYEASHAINRSYAPLLRPLQLTYPQYITMTLLWEKDGQSVGDLCRQLQMESSTLTPLLKRMESLGHVLRQRSKDDERRVIVSLTQSGKALQAAAPEITACMIGATGLKMEELDGLIDTLNALTRTLTDKANTAAE